MKKSLRWLSKINPLYFAVIYFLAMLSASILIYMCPVYELESSFQEINLDSFYTSLYFSLITITTLGYGDIVPGNDATRVLASSLALLGIILTGLFLNSLAFIISSLTQIEDKKKLKHDQYHNQIQQFKNISILLKQNFEDYKYAANSIITPLERYSELTNIENLEKLKFTINDLRDLFKPNTLRRFPFTVSKIEIYYNVFDILHRNLDELLKLGYFNFNPELMNNVIHYLSTSKFTDLRGNILFYAKLDKNQQEWIYKMLSEAKPDVKITEISNAIDDYIVLMEQIKLTVVLILNIEALINSIDL